MIKKYLSIKLFLSIAIGAILGYSYYYFIGCNSGQCPITSSPLISTLYGSLIGLVLAFPTSKEKNNDNKRN